MFSFLLGKNQGMELLGRKIGIHLEEIIRLLSKVVMPFYIPTHHV